MKKLLLRAILTLSAVLLMVLLASQVEQHIFRRRAEMLLTQIQSLELGKTAWSQAKGGLKSWDAESTFDDNCNEGECSVDIRLIEPVYGFISRSKFFVQMDDYIRRRLKLYSNDTGPVVGLDEVLFRGYMLLGGRPARIVALVGMRDGVVSSKGYSAEIQTYWSSVPGLFEGRWNNFALIAAERSVPSFDLSEASHVGHQLTLHPDYAIRGEGGMLRFF